MVICNRRDDQNITNDKPAITSPPRKKTKKMKRVGAATKHQKWVRPACACATRHNYYSIGARFEKFARQSLNGID